LSSISFTWNSLTFYLSVTTEHIFQKGVYIIKNSVKLH